MPKALKVFVPPHRRGKPLPRSANRQAYTHPAWPAIRQAVLLRDLWTCCACGKELHGDDACCDHVHEMQAGGVGITHDLSAYQSLCRSCNSAKARAAQQGRTWTPNPPGGGGRNLGVRTPYRPKPPR